MTENPLKIAALVTVDKDGNPIVTNVKPKQSKRRKTKGYSMRMTKSRANSIYVESFTSMLELLPKKSLILLNDMYAGNDITTQLVLKQPFKYYTPDMSKQMRAQTKKRMLDMRAMIEVNGKLMLSPVVFSPKWSSDIDNTQFYTEAVWFKLTGDDKYLKMSSVEMLETDQFEQFMFYGSQEYKIGPKQRKTCILEGAEVSYTEYISHKVWKDGKRHERMAMDKFKCKECGCEAPLEVHHLTYDNLGKENMEDLITLCSHCHYLKHKDTSSSTVLSVNSSSGSGEEGTITIMVDDEDMYVDIQGHINNRDIVDAIELLQEHLKQEK